MGHRTATGWVVDVQSTAPAQLKPDTFYSVLVAVNGSTVTVSVAGKVAFTYTFAARMLNGAAVGLNKGLVGMGSDNSRGVFDNVALQVLPPQLTYDGTEDFGDGQAQQFTGAQGGAWTVAAGRYASTATGAASYDLVDFGLGHGLQPLSYLELQATLRTSGAGGIAFDAYSGNDFKFVALDVAAQKVLVGHVSSRGGVVVDASVGRTLLANTDYAVVLTLKGLSVAVQIDGALALSFAFDGNVVDGDGRRAEPQRHDLLRRLPRAHERPAVHAAAAAAAGRVDREHERRRGRRRDDEGRDADAHAVGARRGRRDRGVGDVQRLGDGGIGLHGGLGHGDVRRRRDDARRSASRCPATRRSSSTSRSRSTLSSPSGLTLGTSSATVTITNDDTAAPPSLSVADVVDRRSRSQHVDAERHRHAVGGVDVGDHGHDRDAAGRHAARASRRRAATTRPRRRR